MQVVTAPLYGLDAGQNVLVSVDGGGYDGTTGYAANKTNNSGQDTLNLKTADDLVTGTNQRVLSAVSDNPPHLFQIGQAIAISGQDTVYRVQNVEIDADKRLKLTLN